jgi:hypothetical protein
LLHERVKLEKKSFLEQEEYMTNKKLLTLLIAPVFAVGMTACDVDQTQEGEMPEVEVQEGELPAYDVEAADVEVTEDTITVPEVNIEDPDDDGGMTEAEGMAEEGTEGEGGYR